MKYDPFVYGKHQGENVTGLEHDGDIIRMFYRDGQLPTQQVQMDYFILYPEKENDSCFRLNGDLHYKWAQKFKTKKEYQKAIGYAKGTGADYYTIYNPLESFMVKNGVTMYKGMSPKDVSVLSFDIETTGLDPATNKVLMISNTYRNGPRKRTHRALFCIDDYKSEKEMIYAWCSYVCDVNPSILVGHNLFGFDLPFLHKRLQKPLPIGRMQGKAKTARYTSQFRKDGSQSYTYTNVLVPGREALRRAHAFGSRDPLERKTGARESDLVQ